MENAKPVPSAVAEFKQRIRTLDSQVAHDVRYRENLATELKDLTSGIEAKRELIGEYTHVLSLLDS